MHQLSHSLSILFMANLYELKKYLFWGLGFVILFLLDLVVEFYLLPLWGLDNTPRNDIYFIVWWIIVLLWLVFGLKLLKSG